MKLKDEHQKEGAACASSFFNAFLKICYHFEK
jgi:hypothetical protein